MCGRSKEWLKKQATESLFGDTNPLEGLMVHFSKDKNGYLLPEAPSYISIEITNGCNLHCPHCHLHYGVKTYGREKGNMTPETVEIALNEAQKYNITIMMNFDGEPTTHPLFFDYLKRASELGVSTYFNSNGTLLTPDRVDELLEHYTGTVGISLDMTKELFEINRYPAKYDTVSGNLNYLIKRNNKLGNPIKIHISFSNCAQPAEVRKKAIDKWLPLVDSISIAEINDDWGTISSKSRITEISPKKRPLCISPWQTFVVCHNGDVVPCCVSVTKPDYDKVLLGNIRKQPFIEIWHGEKFDRFRKELAAEKYSNNHCAACERWLYQFEFPEELVNGMRIKRDGIFTRIHKVE